MFPCSNPKCPTVSRSHRSNKELASCVAAYRAANSARRSLDPVISAPPAGSPRPAAYVPDRSQRETWPATEGAFRRGTSSRPLNRQ